MSNSTVRLALLLAHDRSGLADLAHELSALGYFIVSAGESAQDLAAAGIKVLTIERLSATPDILDGTIRTLHPAVMAGISARRDRPDHTELLNAYRIGPVDFVAVNLAPAGSNPESPLDLSGAAALLAGANNPQGVAVLCDPADYPKAMAAMREGALSIEVRQGLAIKALAHVVEHLGQVSLGFGGPPLGELGAAPEPPPAAPQGGAELEPAAVLWQSPNGPEQVQLLTDLQQQWLIPPTMSLLQGPALTADLVLDADVAWGALTEFGEAVATAVVSRAGVVCGAGVLAMSVAGAVLRAVDSDPLAAQHATVAINRTIDLGAMRALLARPLALVIAPAFDDDAVEIASAYADLRLLTMGQPNPSSLRRRLRATRLGVLQQDSQAAGDLFQYATCVTATPPDDAQYRALALAWRVVGHQPSCSAVVCDESGTVGISSGLANVGDAIVVAVGKCRRTYKPVAVAVDAPLLGRENLEPLVKLGIHALAVACDEPLAPELLAAAEAHSIRVLCVPRTPKI